MEMVSAFPPGPIDDEDADDHPQMEVASAIPQEPIDDEAADHRPQMEVVSTMDFDSLLPEIRTELLRVFPDELVRLITEFTHWKTCFDSECNKALRDHECEMCGFLFSDCTPVRLLVCDCTRSCEYRGVDWVRCGCRSEPNFDGRQRCSSCCSLACFHE